MRTRCRCLITLCYSFLWHFGGVSSWCCRCRPKETVANAYDYSSRWCCQLAEFRVLKRLQTPFHESRGTNGHPLPLVLMMPPRNFLTHGLFARHMCSLAGSGGLGFGALGTAPVPPGTACILPRRTRCRSAEGANVLWFFVATVLLNSRISRQQQLRWSLGL